MHNKLSVFFLIFVLIISAIFWFSVTIVQAEISKGPLKTRNQFPLFLMFLNPLPTSPGTLSKDQVTLSPAIDYSSIFVQEYSENSDVLIDMEMTVFDLLVEYGIHKDFTLSFQPILVHMGRGFLDDFLETYHDKLGVSNYGRENRPKNEFGYSISFQDQNWCKGKEGGFHLADSQISAKYSILKNRIDLPLSASIAYILKIPFGDPDFGFGSGHFDHGILVLSQASFDRIIVYLNAGYNFLSDPETNGADISIQNTETLFVGFEYIYSPDLSLITQMNYLSSPFKKVEFNQFDNGGIELDFGLIYRCSQKTDFEFSFGEDLAASSVPDFNVHFRITYTFY